MLDIVVIYMVVLLRHGKIEWIIKNDKSRDFKCKDLIILHSTVNKEQVYQISSIMIVVFLELLIHIKLFNKPLWLSIVILILMECKCVPIECPNITNMQIGHQEPLQGLQLKIPIAMIKRQYRHPIIQLKGI